METNLCPECKKEQPWKEFCYRIKECRACRSALASKRQLDRFKKRPWEKTGIRINLLKPKETKQRLRKRKIQNQAWLRRISQKDKKVNLLEYLKNHPCIDCGEDDPLVMEFDHIDPAKKTANIAVLLQDKRVSWDGVLQEIEKCEVRCANCHRRRTAHQFHWWRLEQPEPNNWQTLFKGKRFGLPLTKDIRLQFVGGNSKVVFDSEGGRYSTAEMILADSTLCYGLVYHPKGHLKPSRYFLLTPKGLVDPYQKQYLYRINKPLSQIFPLIWKLL